MIRFHSNRLHILIGEDNLGDIALLKQILKELGFKGTLEVQQTGPAILDYLTGQGEFKTRSIRKLPHLVFLDLNIPKLTGLNVLASIKENKLTCRIPVIMMSSGPHPRDVKKAYSLGCGGFIIKPYDYLVFKDKIQGALNFWCQSFTQSN